MESRRYLPAKAKNALKLLSLLSKSSLSSPKSCDVYFENEREAKFEDLDDKGSEAAAALVAIAAGVVANVDEGEEEPAGTCWFNSEASVAEADDEAVAATAGGAV